jgi:ABC-type transport system involved in multi-copper enzyme maturation permease subunit
MTVPRGANGLIARPQIVGLIATTIISFTIDHVVFQRQEVRAQKKADGPRAARF